MIEARGNLITQAFNPASHKNNLNLGCGKRTDERFDNVDHFPGFVRHGKIIQRELFDEDWRLPLDHYDYIYSNHFFEHIPRGHAFFVIMNNIFRVAKNGAILEVRCPYPHFRSLTEVNHCRLVDVNTFKAFMSLSTNSLGNNEFTERGNLKLLKRDAWGQYHVRKYLRINVPPYMAIVLIFKIHKFV